ncbi:MAG: hypothetical protein ACYDHX_08000 [Methanothrix sp.]
MNLKIETFLEGDAERIRTVLLALETQPLVWGSCIEVLKRLQKAAALMGAPKPLPIHEFPRDILAQVEALCKSIEGQNREDGNEITHAFYEASWDLLPALAAEIIQLRRWLAEKDIAIQDCATGLVARRELLDEQETQLAANETEIKKLREMISESETNYKFYDKIIGEQEEELSAKDEYINWLEEDP